MVWALYPNTDYLTGTYNALATCVAAFDFRTTPNGKLHTEELTSKPERRNSICVNAEQRRLLTKKAIIIINFKNCQAIISWL